LIPQNTSAPFDLINVRILITIFKDGDPDVSLRTVGRMLKSGGWLRWVENRDIGRNISVMNRVPGRKMSGAEKVVGDVKEFYKTRGIKQESVFLFL